jgi:hypothetical protein
LNRGEGRRTPYVLQNSYFYSKKIKEFACVLAGAWYTYFMNKTFTVFFDRHSGGFAKTPYKVVYVELPEHEAREVFEAHFNLNSRNVTCECCGPDFGVWEEEYAEGEYPDEFILTPEHAGDAWPAEF